ncbi:MAG: rod shape-determining protein MreC [Oscillospiraceae bacterium]|jgi:rod shape-determining protein MreC|nr:rod shape-determining protein MreC [Oscillospiraceae bacterium]
MIQTRRRKHHWLTILLAVAALSLMLGTTALLMIERFMPEQDFLPSAIVAAPRQAVMRVLTPIQSAASWVGARVSKAVQDWALRSRLETEYNRVVSQNEQLVYQSLLYEELEAENIMLRNLMEEHNAKIALNPLLARVTAKESGNWFSMFTLDKGTNDGVAAGMAIINKDGLIGVVYETTATTANVVSIIDSRSSIGALLESSRDQGIIKGSLGVEDAARCRMYYLPADSVPRPGDTVITSGVMTTGADASSVAEHMPKGLKIGTVRESMRHTDENKSYIIVEPYVDFMHIEYVLILRYTANPEQMQFADDGQVGYPTVVLDTYIPPPVIGEEDKALIGATPTPIPRPSRVPGESEGSVTELDEGDDLNLLDPDENGDAEPTPTPPPDDPPLEPTLFDWGADEP